MPASRLAGAGAIQCASADPTPAAAAGPSFHRPRGACAAFDAAITGQGASLTAADGASVVISHSGGRVVFKLAAADFICGLFSICLGASTGVDAAECVGCKFSLSSNAAAAIDRARLTVVDADAASSSIGSSLYLRQTPVPRQLSVTMLRARFKSIGFSSLIARSHAAARCAVQLLGSSQRCTTSDYSESTARCLRRT